GRRDYVRAGISPCPKPRPHWASAPAKSAAGVTRVPWQDFLMASTSTCMRRRRRGHAIISRKVSQYETQVLLQIPADAEKDDRVFEVPPAEQCWPFSGHDIPYQTRSTAFATEPERSRLYPIRLEHRRSTGMFGSRPNVKFCCSKT